MKDIKCVVLSLLLASSLAHARWAKVEELPMVVEYSHIDVAINPDGSYTSTSTIKDKVQNDNGIDMATSYTLQYNKSVELLKVLEAYTITDGKKYILPPERIEDKAVRTPQRGFEERREILASFPQVKIGSIIYIKYETKKLHPEIRGVFGVLFGLDSGFYYRHATARFSSSNPIYYKFNSHRGELKVKSNFSNGQYRVDVALQKPMTTTTTLESGLVSPDSVPWVTISNIDAWEEFGRRAAEPFSAAVKQPLPHIFADIVSKARGIKNEVDQLNFVTSQVTENVKYMGVWKRADGSAVPRDLNVIALSKIGDCKDFSVLTAAILNKLGYKANVSLVLGGDDFRPDFAKTTPFVSKFNHAFLKVTGKNSKVYWLDPTPSISMAQATFPHISDREALVLYDQHPVLSRTFSTQGSQYDMVEEYHVKGDGALINVKLRLAGDEARHFTGAQLVSSKKEIEDMLWRSIAGSKITEEQKKRIKVPDLRSRTVRDMEIEAVYQEDGAITKSNMGNRLITLPVSKIIGVITSGRQDQVGGLVLSDAPFKATRKIILKGIKVPKPGTLDFARSSPWMDLKVTCLHVGKDTVLQREVVIKKPVITADELRSQTYRDFKAGLIENFSNIALVWD